MTIIVEGEVDASIAAVWRVVGDFAGLAHWHPDVLTCEISGESIGAQRTLEMKGGRVVERLVKIDPPAHTIGYEVVSADVAEFRGMTGAITLAALSPTKTLVRWSSSFAGAREALDELEPRMARYYQHRIGHLRSAVEQGELE